MKKPIVVLKFGGTSVSSLTCWNNIAKVAKQKLDEGKRPFIVCSAASGISNLLEKTLQSSLTEKSVESCLTEFRQRYSDLASELGVEISLAKKEISELENLFQGALLTEEVGPYLYARVMAKGELVLTQLAHAFLEKSLQKKVSFLKAFHVLKIKKEGERDLWDQFTEANCSDETNTDLIRQINDLESEIILTQGFMAGDEHERVHLLGRGGSDTSASYFAAQLQAQQLEIWTDVPGLYTANPKVIPQARLIKKIDPIEAQEVALAGAKVLHPRCLYPVMKNDIPLSLHWTENPHIEGTQISSKFSEFGGTVKSITYKENVTMISIENLSMWKEVGYLADVFACFKKAQLSLDLLSTAETTVSLTLDETGVGSERKIEQVLKDLEKFGHVTIVKNCSVIGLVGNQIRSILHKISHIFKAFDEKKIYMLGQAANDLNLSFVLSQEDAGSIYRELHGLIFSQMVSEDLFGPSFEELKEEVDGVISTEKSWQQKKWWYQRKEEMLNLLEKSGESSLYLYDLPTVALKIEALQSIGGIQRVFYAMKANSHPDIIRTIYREGGGLECVSVQEIVLVEKSLEDVDYSRIFFTPNFCRKSDYEYALERNILINIDNIDTLIQWSDLFEGKEIFLRIDPLKARGHHQFVKTAGEDSKFGIFMEDILPHLDFFQKKNIRIKGIHAHAGSGISNLHNWSEQAFTMLEFAEKYFPDVEVLNLGGGLSIPYRPGEASFSLKDFALTLENFRKIAGAKYQIWLEPGRYLVGEAGVLISKVSQIKQKKSQRYIGTSSGMNHLIRPSLYGSYHHIVNLTRIEEERIQRANIVGPICESSDILGYQRKMPETHLDDVLLFDCAGAYGYCMGSTYNGFPRPKEIALQ